mgnify:CR=1 FL=1
MSEFLKFTPGEYYDFEREAVQERLDMAAGKRPAGGMPGMGPGPGAMEPKPYTLEEVLAYNHKWDPYNPLFNDIEYAKKAGYSGLPAYPGFCGRGAMAVTPFSKDISSGGFYYTNDGTDIYLARPVCSGDLLKDGPSKGEFKEVTIPGSDLRQWYMGGSGSLVDEAGNVVVYAEGNTRDCYKQYADPDAPKKNFSDNMAEWCEYFPPAHYTSDEDWDRIRDLWAKEEIRGAEPRYWEDVEVGTFMTETCSGPVTYMDMISLYGNMMQLTRKQLCDKEYLKTIFRDPYGNYLFETSIHLGTRNLPNGRMVREEAEYQTRRIIIDMTGDQEEHYRNAGILSLRGCRNIIVRNITFQGPGSIDVGGNDLISCFGGAQHCWIDHCAFMDGMDGNFDITTYSDFITVSWCTFSYTERSYMHQNTNLVGFSDRETPGYLNVTYAFNWWGEGCRQRMPMARVGKIHMLNNYYSSTTASNCINPRINSEFLIEGNYFERGVRHYYSQKDATAVTWCPDNFIAEADQLPASTGTTVTVPYDYTVAPCSEVPAAVTKHAGATLFLTRTVL